MFDSWNFLKKEKGLRLYGYVVLENHLHFIASAPTLADAVKSFKMHSARQLIDLLEQRGAKPLLRAFRALKLRHKTKSQHQVWEEGSHPEQISNDGIMRQKLEYMHNNPVKRGLVPSPERWRWSSWRAWNGPDDPKDDDLPTVTVLKF